LKSELQINQNLLDDYKHYLDHKDKPHSERTRRTDLRHGYAERYPELADDTYIQSMQEALPSVPLTEQQRRRALEQQSLLAAASTNINISKIEPESLLDNKTDSMELESLLNATPR